MTAPAPRRVVVAPDKFKGSLTAVEAADAIGAGVRDVLPDADVTLCPVADGGEGTLDVLLAAGGTRVDLRVSGPLSEPVDAWYVMLDGTAYVESARACGIEHVTPSTDVAPAAHTYGVGELIADALGRGARQIVLTVGGTASTDGGSGMLQALGARLTDGDGRPVGLGGGALGDVAAVDLTEVRALLGEARVRVATDVTNPLHGTDGAAAVFGPQKGAGPAEVATLRTNLERWAQVLGFADRTGAGAGGGISGGAMAALGATAESGFDLVVELTGVADAIAGADLVITGEGSLDAQSLAGKAPAGIAAIARRHGARVAAIAGRIALSADDLAEAGITAAIAIADHAPSVEVAVRDAAALLRRHAADLVHTGP
ncbi:glycerate kinase [Prauserella aidingensis]|uniref:glycerate kinase n=1 Tax=Prauserella aidingensis TaxID=387890 RepID=UPI0020A33BC1|nr:glycerate kinase [Prauserella aidingensis]MCP2252140.1 glycerate kinase [Prauserella aidingensis]